MNHIGYSKDNIPAPRAREVAIHVRKLEKDMALLNAEYKADYAPIRGRSLNLFTGITSVLLSVFGLN